MKKPLRSLSGLIDLECAARLGSFKLAAEELFKTPAAVSQQIRNLEEELGFALFLRHPRNVELTEKGRDFAATVTRVLADLRGKAAALQDSGEENVLRISSTHSFALKWLAPRLTHFTRLHPDLDIRLDASDRVVSLEDDSVDVAIRYGGHEPGDPAVLFRERLVAVYSPDILPPGRDEFTLRDLRDLPLLDEGSNVQWHRYMEANGLPKACHHISKGYSHWGVLAQAAVAGQGVALVAYSIVYEDLRKGALRMMKGRPISYKSAYRLLNNINKDRMPKIVHFRAWLTAEVAEMERALLASTE
ncbi:LysR substrate-binding domain-containing protein [Pseudoduganella namucuonensis]|uniref:LysR family transcriptional regulator, glycine cleavage system transcriptional activator n=1 Tax=Pseudoduganella namucuonensis TaxID=1035707 RepID=A0A1I7L4R0_9BURK|nr:LysR substrate-binding domain-containing protein [Pseudoduganella namucuonensis]SFV04628.1 LysR family transcriptional regulator, glycine cleavage system transcriptional activator [Pseudoduganella namucuonensis]